MTQDPGAAADRLERARTAQVQWAKLSAGQRARALRALRHVIAQHMDEILSVLSAEVGKPPMDALAGDVMVTLEMLRFYERRTSKLLRPKKVSRSHIFFAGTSFEEVLEPHGVVLICAPWNYPLQLAVVPMATALFAGNAVLLKCSEHTPRTAQLISDLCLRADLPQDLVQVSFETPEQAAALLAAGPDLVFFTGSNRNGRIVAAQAAQQMIPSIMELGGKDAALIFASCDLERTVNGVAYGSFSNAGQVCVGTRRIYVQQAIYDSFLRLFVKRVAQLRPGTTTESDLGPIRIEAVTTRLQAQVEDAIDRGAKLHTIESTDPGITRPIILTDVPADAALLREESFGPVVCIAPFQTEAEAIAAANGSTFALSASIWTGDKTQAQRLARQLHSGSCSINDAIRTIGNPHAAFGGNKASGFGRYHGAEGLRTFSRIKSIMTSTRPRPTEVHWFPFRAKTFSQLRSVLQIRHGRTLRDRMKALTGLWMLVPFLVCSVCSAAQTNTPGNVIVELTLPPNAHGEIAYLVFTKPDGFPDNRDKALIHNFVPADSAGAPPHRIDLGPLPPGRYAVSVYLDENGDHKLDKNLFGLPKEPVGISNNPKSRMGPPSFDQSVFIHGADAQSIPITLISCCKP